MDNNQLNNVPNNTNNTVPVNTNDIPVNPSNLGVVSNTSNDLSNNVASGLQPVNASAPQITEVAPPVVAPPIISNPANVNTTSDNRILKPIVEEVKVEEPVASAAPVESVQQNNEPEVNKAPENTIMENKKMEQVNIEYKPPGKFKMFLMILTFILILGAVIFLPEINMFVEKMKEQKEPVVEEEAIQNGHLSCSLETSNETFDLIYSTEFSFENKFVKGLNYEVTTRGDRTLDSEALTLLYNNCKSLETDLSQVNLGTEISCDMFEGTVTTSQSIDFELFNAKEAKKIYEKHSIEIPDFELNENIDDIEKSLKTAGYTCEMIKSE